MVKVLKYNSGFINDAAHELTMKLHTRSSKAGFELTHLGVFLYLSANADLQLLLSGREEPSFEAFEAYSANSGVVSSITGTQPTVKTGTARELIETRELIEARQINPLVVSCLVLLVRQNLD